MVIEIRGVEKGELAVPVNNIYMTNYDQIKKRINHHDYQSNSGNNETIVIVIIL